MYTSAKTVLSTILLNSDTEQILEEYILNYLKLRPHIVSQYIKQQGLYHVFARTKDPAYTSTYESTDFILIHSFPTEEEAAQYVIKNGHHILELTPYSYVLTIIYQLDKYNDLYLISRKQFPTYAFSEEAYNMICNEYNRSFSNSTIDDADWLYYIKYK